MRIPLAEAELKAVVNALGNRLIRTVLERVLADRAESRIVDAACLTCGDELADRLNDVVRPLANIPYAERHCFVQFVIRAKRELLRLRRTKIGIDQIETRVACHRSAVELRAVGPGAAVTRRRRRIVTGD